MRPLAWTWRITDRWQNHSNRLGTPTVLVGSRTRLDLWNALLLLIVLGIWGTAQENKAAYRMKLSQSPPCFSDEPPCSSNERCQYLEEVLEKKKKQTRNKVQNQLKSIEFSPWTTLTGKVSLYQTTGFQQEIQFGPNPQKLCQVSALVLVSGHFWCNKCSKKNSNTNKTSELVFGIDHLRSIMNVAPNICLEAKETCGSCLDRFWFSHVTAWQWHLTSVFGERSMFSFSASSLCIPRFTSCGSSAKNWTNPTHNTSNLDPALKLIYIYISSNCVPNLGWCLSGKQQRKPPLDEPQCEGPWVEERKGSDWQLRNTTIFNLKNPNH